MSLPLELALSVTFPSFEHDLLDDIYNATHSPLISGLALESLFRFCAALVQADNQITTRIVSNLVISSEKAQKAETSPANVAKCVALIVKSERGVAAGIIAEYAKHLKVNTSNSYLLGPTDVHHFLQKGTKSKPLLVTLSLLIVSELGRFT